MNKIDRREFFKKAGYSSAAFMFLSSYNNLGAKMYNVDREFKIPSWWAPHEVKGAEAAFKNYFTPNTGVTVKWDTSIAGSDFFAKLQTNLVGDEFENDTFSFGTGKFLKIEKQLCINYRCNIWDRP